MTSSAKQTEGGLRERLGRWAGARAELIGAGALVAAGWLLILAINRWYLGAPQVFLCLGWVSIVAAGRLLWMSAIRAGSELDGPEEIEPVSLSRATELAREKKALLKAIKEVEFDRELGKMSDEDADEIVRVYRARAIEILKLLDGGAADGPAVAAAGEPVDQVIEREVRARLALAGVKPKVKAPAKPAKPAKDDADEPAEEVKP
jgi:hypothetical protein